MFFEVHAAKQLTKVKLFISLAIEEAFEVEHNSSWIGLSKGQVNPYKEVMVRITDLLMKIESTMEKLAYTFNDAACVPVGNDEDDEEINHYMSNVREEAVAVINETIDLFGKTMTDSFGKVWFEAIKKSRGQKLKKMSDDEVRDMMNKHNNNISASAKEIGVHRTSLHARLEKIAFKRS